MLVADLRVTHVALEAGMPGQRAVGDLAMRVDVGLCVIGVLGEALWRSADAAV